MTEMYRGRGGKFISRAQHQRNVRRRFLRLVKKNREHDAMMRDRARSEARKSLIKGILLIIVTAILILFYL